MKYRIIKDARALYRVERKFSGPYSSVGGSYLHVELARSRARADAKMRRSEIEHAVIVGEIVEEIEL